MSLYSKKICRENITHNFYKDFFKDNYSTNKDPDKIEYACFELKFLEGFVSEDYCVFPKVESHLDIFLDLNEAIFNSMNKKEAYEIKKKFVYISKLVIKKITRWLEYKHYKSVMSHINDFLKYCNNCGISWEKLTRNKVTKWLKNKNINYRYSFIIDCFAETASECLYFSFFQKHISFYNPKKDFNAKNIITYTQNSKCLYKNDTMLDNYLKLVIMASGNFPLVITDFNKFYQKESHAELNQKVILLKNKIKDKLSKTEFSLFKIDLVKTVNYFLNTFSPAEADIIYFTFGLKKGIFCFPFDEKFNKYFKITNENSENVAKYYRRSARRLRRLNFYLFELFYHYKMNINNLLKVN